MCFEMFSIDLTNRLLLRPLLLLLLQHATTTSKETDYHRSKGPERPQQQSSEMPGTSRIQHNQDEKNNQQSNNYREIHHVRLTCTNFVCTFESRYLPHLLHEPLQHQGLCLLMQAPPQKKTSCSNTMKYFCTLL